MESSIGAAVPGVTVTSVTFRSVSVRLRDYVPSSSVGPEPTTRKRKQEVRSAEPCPAGFPPPNETNPDRGGGTTTGRPDALGVKPTPESAGLPFRPEPDS